MGGDCSSSSKPVHHADKRKVRVVPKHQKGQAPKEGAFRRNRGSKSNTTGKSQSGSIAGKITKALWGKLTGWDNPGR